MHCSETLFHIPLFQYTHFLLSETLPGLGKAMPLEAAQQSYWFHQEYILCMKLMSKINRQF